MTSYPKLYSVSWCVFARETIVPNFIPIGFESAEPWAFLVAVIPTAIRKTRREAIWYDCKPDPKWKQYFYGPQCIMTRQKLSRGRICISSKFSVKSWMHQMHVRQHEFCVTSPSLCPVILLLCLVLRSCKQERSNHLFYAGTLVIGIISAGNAWDKLISQSPHVSNALTPLPAFWHASGTRYSRCVTDNVLICVLAQLRLRLQAFPGPDV